MARHNRQREQHHDDRGTAEWHRFMGQGYPQISQQYTDQSIRPTGRLAQASAHMGRQRKNQGYGSTNTYPKRDMGIQPAYMAVINGSSLDGQRHHARKCHRTAVGRISRMWEDYILLTDTASGTAHLLQ